MSVCLSLPLFLSLPLMYVFHVSPSWQAEKKVVTCRSTMENADSLYVDAVRALEEARQNWEREMELLCQVGEGTVSFTRAFYTHTH